MRSYSVDKPIIIKAHAVKYFTNLASHQPFQNRTIHRKSPTLLPYERSVGFASLRNSGRSTSGIHARALSKVRCCRPIKFGRRPEELQHLLRPFRFSDTSVNNPSVTVTENVILRQHIFYFNINIIAFTCDMSTLFILQIFLPSRRRDCNTYCALSISLTPPLTIPQSQ